MASLYAAAHSGDGNENAMGLSSFRAPRNLLHSSTRTMSRPSAPAKPKVHGRGNPRLDAVLEFAAFAARPMPLVTLLDEAPRRIAAIFDAEVCSLYLLEGDGNELVMRGNVGFSREALGQVRLHIGEGITGKAVEYLR